MPAFAGMMKEKEAMVRVVGIDHLVIRVSDFDKSKAFYEQALGFKEATSFTVEGEFAKSVGLTDSLPFTVHVMQSGDGTDATAVKLMEFQGTRPSRPDNSFIHSTYGVRYLTLYVNDLKAALEQCAEHGVKPLGDGAKPIPESIAAGMSLALIRDPDGNFIELVGPTSR